MRGVSTRDLCTPNPGILRGPFAAVGPVSRGGGRVCSKDQQHTPPPGPQKCRTLGFTQTHEAESTVNRASNDLPTHNRVRGSRTGAQGTRLSLLPELGT